jgi:1-acyl-sn-glycerol-3-phosphate acyltransferase
MGPSIADTFAAKSILITGGTGFLGKVLAEKILRDLPEVRRIHLFIRPRSSRGRVVSAPDRLLSEVLGTALFDRLREKLGGGFADFCAEKIDCVSGDLSQRQFGLDAEAYRALQAKTDIIIHCAANVVFDERLDLALELNTLVAVQLLQFAREAKASYIHLSTAYVSGRRQGLIPDELLAPEESLRSLGVPDHILETFDVEGEVQRLQVLVEETKKRFADRPRSPELHAQLVKVGMDEAQRHGWNDTYGFTKWLGEQLVHRHRGEVPAAIVRPSIIESSLREPAPGWIDGLRMTDPLIIGFGKGRITDFPMHRDVVLDMIPVDLVANAIIATVAAVAEKPTELHLLTIASGLENPLTGHELFVYCEDYFSENPMRTRKGKPIKTRRFMFPSPQDWRRQFEGRYLRIVRFSIRVLGQFTLLPAVRALRRRLRELQLQIERVLYYADIYAPYANLHCRFEITRAKALSARLSEEERVRFPFDPTVIDWGRYIREIHIPGLKRNVLHIFDSEEVAPAETARSPLADAPGAPAPRGISKTMRTLAEAVISMLMTSYWRVQGRGVENLPAKGPCIFAANHCSHLDLVVIRKALKMRTGDLCVFGAKEYFFNTPFKSWFFGTMFNVLPLARSEHPAKGLAACKKVLQAGGSILLFPEGTRSLTGRLQPFKKGIGVLALELGVPVIPISVHGTFESLPKGRCIPRPNRINVRIGRPMNFDALKLSPGAGPARGLHRQAAEQVRAQIEALAGA